MKSKKDYPDNWEMLEFADFVIRSSKRFNPKKNDGDYKCIELEHIQEKTGRITGFTKSSTQKSTKNIFNEGQILYGKLRPYLKKYWHADFKGVCSSEIWVLDSKDEKCLNSYLFYLIQTHRFDQVANVSSGTKMPRADWGFISDYPFAIPPKKEQKGIVEILSTWDETISKTEKLIKAKKRYKNGLMQRLFSSNVRFPEFEKEEWVGVKLKKFFKPFSDKNKDNEDLPILSCSKVHGITLQSNIFDKRVASKDIKRYKVVERDDLIYDPMLLWDASIGFLKEVDRGVISPAYNTFKFKKNSGYRPFFEYLFDTHYMRYNYKAISQGTNRRRRKAPAEAFLNIDVKVPKSIDEQKKIASLLGSLTKEIELLKEEITFFQNQKKGLMKQLLTGKVRVS